MNTSAPSRRHRSATPHAIDRALETPITSARCPLSITPAPPQNNAVTLLWCASTTLVWSIMECRGSVCRYSSLEAKQFTISNKNTVLLGEYRHFTHSLLKNYRWCPYMFRFHHSTHVLSLHVLSLRSHLVSSASHALFFWPIISGNS